MNVNVKAACPGCSVVLAEWSEKSEPSGEIGHSFDERSEGPTPRINSPATRFIAGTDSVLSLKGKPDRDD